MTNEDKISALALRAVIDSYEEVLGLPGKNSILNFARLSDLIVEPPPYSEDVDYPHEYVDRIIRSSLDVMGEAGTRAIVIRAGRKTIELVKRASETVQSLADSGDMSGYEKMKALLAYYAHQINRPPEFDFNEDVIVFHNPGCTLCDGIKTEKPSCTYVSGVFEGMGLFIAGYPEIRCVETECKASGGVECRYEIRLNPQGED